MDFPLELGGKFISGYSELKQCISALFWNSKTSFLQNRELGSACPEHSSDVELIEFGVKKTLEQIPNCELIACKVTPTGLGEADIYIQISYNSQITEFKFSV